MKKGFRALLILCMLIGMGITPLMAAAEGETGTTTAAVQRVQATDSAAIAADLGVLLGDGNGVTDAYLAKTSTRVQGAILTLRLLGKEKEALSFSGTDTFSDATSVGSAIRPVLAYLKQHPELGWNGTGGGKFSPNAPLTAQQVYKVMLESLSYRTGTDFQYADALSFAASKGLSRAAAAAPFTNRDLAAALIETLQTAPKDAVAPLSDALVQLGVIAADKATALSGQRVDLRKAADGSTYLTDGKGMALYLFTKDSADLNSCQGQCLANWPVFGADRLILGNGLNPDDFGVFTRSDGTTKQLTYKGWPLYYFVNDSAPGDVKGEGVGGVWYLVKQPFYSVTVGTDPKLGNYLTDADGMSLYYFDKDVQGSSACSGTCIQNWPAFHAESIVVPSGLKAADFGEITREDGTKQTTFKGYPLYYWVKDTKRGDVTGQGVNEIWFVVDPAKFAGTTAGAEAASKVVIEMKNYAFTPGEITVKAGTVIEFVNRDTAKHNAVFVDGSFKSELLSQGQTATVKLDKPGTYEFYCEPHQDHMRGVITVQ